MNAVLVALHYGYYYLFIYFLFLYSFIFDYFFLSFFFLSYTHNSLPQEQAMARYAVACDVASPLTNIDMTLNLQLIDTACDVDVTTDDDSGRFASQQTILFDAQYKVVALHSTNSDVEKDAVEKDEFVVVLQRNDVAAANFATPTAVASFVAVVRNGSVVGNLVPLPDRQVVGCCASLIVVASDHAVEGLALDDGRSICKISTESRPTVAIVERRKLVIREAQGRARIVELKAGDSGIEVVRETKAFGNVHSYVTIASNEFDDEVFFTDSFNSVVVHHWKRDNLIVQVRSFSH